MAGEKKDLIVMSAVNIDATAKSAIKVDEKTRIFYSFFMQLTPNQALIGEGIGQHLMQLLRGFNAIDNVGIIICVPIWSRGQLRRALRVYKVSTHNIEIKTFGPKYLWKYLAPRKRTKFEENPARLFVRFFEYFGTGIFWPLLPLAATIAKPKKLASQSDFEVKEDSNLWWRLTRRMWSSLQVATFSQMAAYINRDRRIRACFIPLGSWDMSKLVDKKPIIPAIPDLVYLEFPEVFDRNESLNFLNKQIFTVARQASAIITVSEYVKQRHLVEFFGMPTSKVKVIHHAPMDLSYVLQRFVPRFGKTQYDVAKLIVDRFISRRLGSLNSLDRLNGSIYWLSQIRRSEVMERPLIYFPTQNRPYKNFKRLFRAIAELRNRGLDVTLFLTGDIRSDKELLKIVKDEDLYGNIVPLPRLAAHHHAAFYGVSDLVVGPSLFEGGDKYTFLFCEALSMNTPVIFAENRTSKGTFPTSIASDTFFDPTSVKAIADRISSALHDSTLLPRQLKVYNDWKSERKWKDVATEYVDTAEFAVNNFRLIKPAFKLIRFFKRSPK